MNRDLLTNANPEAVAEGAMACIDAVQTRRQEVQPLALACAFLLLAERLRLEPQDLATWAKALMLAPSGQRVPEFRAVTAYIQNEIPR